MVPGLPELTTYTVKLVAFTVPIMGNSDHVIGLRLLPFLHEDLVKLLAPITQ